MTTVLHLYDHRTAPAAGPAMHTLRRRQGAGLVARVGGRTRGDLPETDHVLRRLWGWSLTASPEILRLVEAFDVTAIHCWSPTVAEAAAAIGRPTVLSVFRPPSPRRAKAIRAAAATGVHVTVPSSTLADLLARSGVSPDRLHIIEPAAEPIDRTEATRAAARRRLDIGAEARVLIAPPQHGRDRSPYRAVWALGILHHAGLITHLIVPGARSQTGSAQRAAVDTGMARWVHFPGPVGPDDGRALWSAADVAVLYDDAGFALPVAAMAVAAGVPIVAADAGELAAVLCDGDTALLVPPRTPRLLAAAIWRLHNQPDLGASLAAAAAAKLGALTDVDRMVSRFDPLYAAAGAAAKEHTP